MTIPSMPGFDETVAPGLAKIADAIHGIIRPYHRVEQDLRRQIQRDPRVATQLADMEYANPGSVGKVFGPNVENYAKALAPSVEARLNKKIGENVEGALSDPKAINFLTNKYLGFQPSDIKKEDVTLTQLQNMEQMMAEHPELAQDAAFTQLMGTTRARYENDQAELGATRGAEAFLTGRGAGLRPDQILDAVLGKQVIGPDGKPVAVSTREVADLFQSPTYGNLFKTLFANKIEDQREAMRLKLAAARDHKSLSDSFTEMKARSAIQRSTEVENTSPAAVAAATYGMNDPSVTILGGVTDPKDPGFARFQEQVKTAQEQIRLEGQQEQNVRVRQAQGNVITQQKLLNGMITGGASDAEIASQVAQLNIALEDAGNITGHVVRAAYTLDPERFFAGSKFDRLRNKGVYYFDENGNPIQETSVPTYVANQGEAKPLEVPKGEKGKEGTTSSAGKAGVVTPDTTGTVKVSAKDIFPGISPTMAVQMDRVQMIPDKAQRQAYYEKAVQQNPGMTDAQKQNLKKLFNVD